MNSGDLVPDPLLDWVGRYGVGRLEADGEELVVAGCRALVTAISLPPSERTGAHALLAADALLTAAVEHAAAGADPEAFLRSVIERVSSRRPEGEGM